GLARLIVDRNALDDGVGHLGVALDHRANGTAERLPEGIAALERGDGAARGIIFGLWDAARVVARARDAGPSLAAIEALAGSRRRPRSYDHRPVPLRGRALRDQRGDRLAEPLPLLAVPARQRQRVRRERRRRLGGVPGDGRPRPDPRVRVVSRSLSRLLLSVRLAALQPHARASGLPPDPARPPRSVPGRATAVARR